MPRRPVLATSTEVASILRDVRERMVGEPVAYSADGRDFQYEAPLTAEIQVGGWVLLRTPTRTQYLGRVVTEEIVSREGPALRIDVAGDAARADGSARLASADLHPRVRLSSGIGTLLARKDGARLVATSGGDTFDDATIETADAATVAAYLAQMSGKRARLPIGTVERAADAPAAFLRADGFNRHTFFCGQSGSGKTYSLGLVLEQLLLNTDLRIVVLDPNSDFVRIRETRPGADRALARPYRERAGRLAVLRPPSAGGPPRETLRTRFSDLDEREQAAALRLDPLADRDEYGLLAEIDRDFGAKKYSLGDVLAHAERSDDPAARQLALRIRNLRVADWSVWAKPGQKTSVEHLSADRRGMVLDIGSLPSSAEKLVVAGTVLGTLWRNREQRRPVLIVIDEAHNVCPAEPRSALQENTTQYCINIAAEGRKFGLYLLVSTQRPQKVHPNVLSQCDNLVLMRMNSLGDLAEMSATFSFVPPSLMSEATRFRQGEALVAGGIVPTPLFVRFGARLSEEGGSDVPAAWADARRISRTSGGSR